jgi:hypothetical protein
MVKQNSQEEVYDLSPGSFGRFFRFFMYLASLNGTFLFIISNNSMARVCPISCFASNSGWPLFIKRFSVTAVSAGSSELTWLSIISRIAFHKFSLTFIL